MVTDVQLENFRSYLSDSFEFSPQVNIVVGPNASGKTNLLEAILVICRGSSYRGQDDELISFDKDWSRLESYSDNNQRAVKLQRNGDKVTKSYVINTQALSRLNLNKTLPVVVFEPNHLQLLIGPPELRRAYLDDILEQTAVGYKVLKQQYRRTLAQRNRYLKNGINSLDELFVWNVRLSQLAGQVVKHRFELTSQINEQIGEAYKKIAKSKDQVSISYQTNFNHTTYESDLLKKLETTIDVDRERGFTGHGPHREDIQIYINKNLAAETASRGETRSLVLGLKIIEAGIVENQRNIKPILLLDDVFSELDGSRRVGLVKTIHKYQTFITTTDADIVVDHFTQSTNVIALQKTKAGR